MRVQGGNGAARGENGETSGRGKRPGKTCKGHDEIVLPFEVRARRFSARGSRRGQSEVTMAGEPPRFHLGDLAAAAAILQVLRGAVLDPAAIGIAPVEAFMRQTIAAFALDRTAGSGRSRCVHFLDHFHHPMMGRAKRLRGSEPRFSTVCAYHTPRALLQAAPGRSGSFAAKIQASAKIHPEV